MATLSADTIAASIAALSVTGLTIKDLDAIPQQVQARDCPIMFPDPTKFFSNLVVTVDTFGSNSARKTINYTLSYVLLYAEAGEERGLYKVYQPLVQMALSVIDALLINDALNGCIDIQPQDVPIFGTLTDPSGKAFYGATYSFRVVEFSEV